MYRLSSPSRNTRPASASSPNKQPQSPRAQTTSLASPLTLMRRQIAEQRVTANSPSSPQSSAQSPRNSTLSRTGDTPDDTPNPYRTAMDGSLVARSPPSYSSPTSAGNGSLQASMVRASSPQRTTFATIQRSQNLIPTPRASSPLKAASPRDFYQSPLKRPHLVETPIRKPAAPKQESAAAYYGITAFRKRRLLAWFDHLGICAPIETASQEFRSGYLFILLLERLDPHVEFVGVHRKALVASAASRNVEQVLAVVFKRSPRVKFVPQTSEIVMGHEDAIFSLLNEIFDVYVLRDVKHKMPTMLNAMNVVLLQYGAALTPDTISPPHTGAWNHFRSGVPFFCAMHYFLPQHLRPELGRVYRYPRIREEFLWNLHYLFSALAALGVECIFSAEEYLSSLDVEMLWYQWDHFVRALRVYRPMDPQPSPFGFRDDDRMQEELRKSQESRAKRSDVSPHPTEGDSPRDSAASSSSQSRQRQSSTSSTPNSPRNRRNSASQQPSQTQGSQPPAPDQRAAASAPDADDDVVPTNRPSDTEPEPVDGLNSGGSPDDGLSPAV